MVDDKSEESFEDEFDFLNEEKLDDDSGTNAEPVAAISSAKPVKQPFKIKSTSILAIVAVVGVLGIIMLSLRPSNNTHTAKAELKSDLPPLAAGAPHEIKAPDTAAAGTTNTQASGVPAETAPPNQAMNPVGGEANIPPATTNGKMLSPGNASIEQLDITSALEGNDSEAKSRDEIAQLFGNKTSKDKPNKSLDTQAVINDNHETTKSNLVVNKNSPENTDNTEIKDSLSSINKEIGQHSNQIQQLKGTLKEISSTLTQLNQSIGSMDTKVLSLTETVSQLSGDLGGVKKVITDEDLDLTSNSKLASASTRPSLTYKAPEYIVHAIIPGRAWLKSASGQIITVAEGDVVGDYGTVAVIDAANNLVRTSSGVTFR